MNKNKQPFVIFVGGETAGPVMPLLALANAWRESDKTITPVFLDVRKSVAAYIVPRHGYEFRTMTSGKFRRYWSFKNLFSPLQILIGIVRSALLLKKLKPIVVVSAGGYVQVPVIIAAWIMRIPRVIHQQDIIPTFSNKLSSPFATKITTTFEKSLKDFSQGFGFEKNYSADTKTIWTGNPCAIAHSKENIHQLKEEATKLFKLDPEWPTVLVIGGGSGAMGLNQVLAHNLPELLKTAQVIHSAGKGKMVSPQLNSPVLHDRYHQYEFIERTDLAYAAADIVIARAGIGTLTELSALEKMSIIVPMPHSHQEWNAQFLFDRKAAVVVDQADITPDLLTKVVKKILFDIKLQQQLQTNIKNIMPRNATTAVLTVIQSVI